MFAFGKGRGKSDGKGKGKGKGKSKAKAESKGKSKGRAGTMERQGTKGMDKGTLLEATGKASVSYSATSPSSVSTRSRHRQYTCQCGNHGLKSIKKRPLLVLIIKRIHRRDCCYS